jgi:hypothetical protein
MDALRIAFDTIIVGALALPWVFFGADLFFLKNPEDDRWAINAWALPDRMRTLRDLFSNPNRGRSCYRKITALRDEK